MRSRVAFVLTTLLAGVGAFADCTPPVEPVVTDAKGRAVCAVHRIPVIHAAGYYNVPDDTLVHWYGEFGRLMDCNPLSLYPSASLKRTEEFRHPGDVLYCPKCEQVVAAAGRRLEEKDKRDGSRKP